MNVHGSSGAARSLGRGLEEVSHLFLSRPAATPAGEPTGDGATEPAPARPGSRSGVGVLRPGASLTKDQLLATLRECRGALTGSLTAIGPGVSCGQYGDIDLLALDGTQQLAIIDVDTAAGDGLLLRGISHVDWIVLNLALVQRLYPEWAIDRSRPPRLLLVAPRFSPLMRSAIRQITRPAISCFRYREVELSGRTGIFVECLDGED